MKKIFFNTSEFHKNGFVVIKNVISKTLIKNFEKDIKTTYLHLNKKKKYKKENFASFFKSYPRRKELYKLMQNMSIVKEILGHVDKIFGKSNVYKKLKFKIPSYNTSLIMSVPKEEMFVLPPHQDHGDFYSKNIFKIWLPMTQVDEKFGSFKLYTGSHKKGLYDHEFITKSHTAEVKRKYLLKYKTKIIKSKPGTLIIFNPMIVHQSIKNISKQMRFIITSQFQNITSLEKKPSKFLLKMSKIERARANARKKLNFN
jgi:ectoine hydroxylase-related dioxygenase (phytanoyl-CoA dioxygenase family)